MPFAVKPPPEVSLTARPQSDSRYRAPVIPVTHGDADANACRPSSRVAPSVGASVRAGVAGPQSRGDDVELIFRRRPAYESAAGAPVERSLSTLLTPGQMSENGDSVARERANPAYPPIRET